MQDFITANPRLEQFLYMHRIGFRCFRKNTDMLTEWVYDSTPRLLEVVEEFRRIWGVR